MKKSKISYNESRQCHTLEEFGGQENEETDCGDKGIKDKDRKKVD